MQLKLVLLFLALYQTEAMNDTAIKKLTGGDQCDVLKYPFIVSLRRLTSLQHFCAGTLFKTNWVLTAARCVSAHVTNPQLFTVIAGMSQLNQLSLQRNAVKKIFIHPFYNELNHDNDVAVILLEHDFIVTELVRPINIPSHVIAEEVRDLCPEAVTVGWVWHNKSKVQHVETGSIPHVPIMQCIVNLPVMSDEECVQVRTGLHLRPNTFCAMVNDSVDNFCQGDSGGPLFCGNMQYGVVSEGYTCKSLYDTPGYYTRIDRVLNFIKECMDGKMFLGKRIDYQHGVEDCATTTTFTTLFIYFLLILSKIC